jgi:hypothetical protein
MFDAISHSRAAAPVPITEGKQGSVPKRQPLIQCRQCSEQFTRSTVICPRCNRVNDRSPLVLSIKCLALLLFIGTVLWAVSIAGKAPAEGTGNSSGVEVQTLPTRTQSSSGEPDVRF